MPGTQNIQIYDALLRRGKGTIDHYLVRHEYAATQMADGFARATGEVGVAITVPGPGASNASTGNFRGVHRLRTGSADYGTERFQPLQQTSKQNVPRFGSDAVFRVAYEVLRHRTHCR